MNKLTEKEIGKIYAAVFKKIYAKSEIEKLAKGVRSGLLQKAAVLESSKDYNKFARKYSVEIARKGVMYKRGDWRKYYNAARKLHYIGLPTTYSLFEQQVFEKAVQHNFTMIKTIPKRTLEILERKYTDVLIQQVAKGTLPRGAFEKELKKHGATHARVIARTESAKLQTHIIENRARNIGSKAYTWLASNDPRTRKSHKEMNGVVVLWGEPMKKPLRDNMRGDAGEFPNCRCSPQPILDESDLTKSVYKFYNSANDNIISITKIKLIEILAEG